jgi:hypothetical protein
LGVNVILTDVTFPVLWVLLPIHAQAQGMGSRHPRVYRDMVVVLIGLPIYSFTVIQRMTIVVPTQMGFSLLSFGYSTI